jgi:hypothetical protein
MAIARIKNPVGSKDPTTTNLTRKGFKHLILGPFSTGTSAALYAGSLVNVTNAGVLAKAATKVRAAGFVEYRPTYNWGTTTPSLTALLPDYIDVYVCAFGCGLVRFDVSDTKDAALLGTAVYSSSTAGLASTAIDGNLDSAGQVPIGTLLDLTAGNDGADGQLNEVFFGNGTNGVVST